MVGASRLDLFARGAKEPFLAALVIGQEDIYLPVDPGHESGLRSEWDKIMDE